MNRLSRCRKLSYNGLFESETIKTYLNNGTDDPLEVLSILIGFGMSRIGKSCGSSVRH